MCYILFFNKKGQSFAKDIAESNQIIRQFIQLSIYITFASLIKNYKLPKHF